MHSGVGYVHLISAWDYEARAGHASVPGSELVLLPGHGHNDLSLSSRYWAALARFVRGG